MDGIFVRGAADIRSALGDSVMQACSLFLAVSESSRLASLSHL